MILEEVLPHPFREEIYLNTIITPYNEIEFRVKKIINQILLIEVSNRRLEVAAV